ncbi:MAG: hypothetical protein O3B47_03080 [bacterium]|nr:hypothetical protein [bacterium]
MKPGKYLTTMIAALIVIAIAVASFIFSLVNGDPEIPGPDLIETQEDNVGFPDHKPNIPKPTSPPE